MKKIIAALIAVVVLSVAVPVFADSKVINCGACYGTGKCRTCGGRGFRMVIKYHSLRDKNGRLYNQPYNAKVRCDVCYSGKCSSCNGTGKKVIYY